ncbi:hypothetical protein [Rhizobium sp. SL86]|uniref:hypothetical protein n=1 Tax=Rhizobium sp. SL86 TaxID=2995148 RepID=UPI002274900B|nr:hypothetical protein [Rhizobium sp. SL86]MCY1667882.1 hypothetical protein [Rhizobium sp. SL86]
MLSRIVPLLSGAAVLVLALLVASVALAHQAAAGWEYDAYCCNGNSHTGDCQMIRTDRVRITAEGYEIELRPGDHRLVTVHHRHVVPIAEARRSRDEFYHLCLYPDEYTLRCFYAPDMAY